MVQIGAKWCAQRTSHGLDGANACALRLAEFGQKCRVQIPMSALIFHYLRDSGSQTWNVCAALTVYSI